MSSVDLSAFLTSYTLIVGFVAIAEWLQSRRAAAILTAAAALGAIAATTVVGFYLKPGQSYVELLWFLIRQRDFSVVVSLGLGVAAALVWVTRLMDRASSTSGDLRRQTRRQGLAQVVLAASILGVVLCSQAFIWKEIRGFQRDPVARMHAPGFVVEKIAKLNFPPIRVAVSDDTTYVSYDYFQEAGVLGGGIIAITKDETGTFQQKVVADSPLLMRGYGLAARGGDLFVSRSGVLARADQGTIEYEASGAVTQLRDTDGDGYFEFAHDIVTGLPGIRGPETMHQNNGICFGSDGSLYVAVASSANRGLDEHPWCGTVLRTEPDFSQPEVFARGFRNPFGIVLGPENELFITDNDADENPGDELNHLVRGAHYGHPYIVPKEASIESAGFREPILVGEPEWTFQGMCYATSPALPEAYRNCIYIADYMQHRVLRLKLERFGDTFRVANWDTFVSLSSPIDIAVTPSGDFFVLSRHTRNVYRIRPPLANTGGCCE